MDWRIQEAGVVVGAVLCIVPLVVGTSSYSGPGGTAIDPGAFAASWNKTASIMTYPLLASLALAILGIAWQGPIRRKLAWLVASSSFCLGCFVLVTGASVAFATIDYPGGAGATVAAQNLLSICLVVPTLGFFSSMIWLFWDGRRNPKSVTIPLRRIRECDEEQASTSHSEPYHEMLEMRDTETYSVGDMRRFVSLGVAGCVIGLAMSIGALVMVHYNPVITGSNFDVVDAYSFLGLFFGGVFIGMIGLGIIMYVVVCRSQTSRP